MNDDDLAKSLARSVDLRVRNVSARPDVADLFARVGRRSSRQRRWLVGGLLAVLALGGVGGYLIGHTGRDSAPAAVAVPGEGLPPVDASNPALEPADIVAARAAIAQAFSDAYAGGVPEDVRNAAIQDGSKLLTLRRESLAYAARYGYTSEQLAGSSIAVLGVTFIDEMHAAVRFTITIPEHGDVLVDRVGYAIFDGGRWKVALRTACDLLSLGGLRSSCPPQ
jgi:hypothetical protein